jgi:hypothetical protein
MSPDEYPNIIANRSLPLLSGLLPSYNYSSLYHFLHCITSAVETAVYP